MKKILYFTLVGALFASCSTDLGSLNKNGKAPESVPSSALFANATMSFFDFTSNQNVNSNNLKLWTQQWTQVTYIQESNFELNERNVNGNTFTTMYTTVLRDCKEAKAALVNAPATSAEITAAEACIDVVEVMTYQLLVDLFGDVPYSAALSEETNTPVYDDDAEIYESLLMKLDDAVANLNGSSAFGSSDILYGGDASSWKKAAYSLMLRMAVRMIDYDAAAAKSWGEKAIAGGVFMSSADDMRLFYSSAPPHTHPLWVTLVQSGRTDFVASSTLADVMNGLSDPRRTGFFKSLGGSDSIIASLPGDNISDYYQFSAPGTMMEDPTFTHAAISYVEVEFLMAHAAVAGWAGAGDAATHYENGIRASIEEWGGSSAGADAYMMHPLVAFSSTTAATQIGVQKWIAMYSNSPEAYATIRQYDVPMNVAVVAQTVTPNRYSYPLSELALNEDNVLAAASKFNGDDTFAKVFWDM